MRSLQPTMKTYTVAERAQIIYQTVVGVFDCASSSEVVTPPEVVSHQLDLIPSLEGKILVPGAGIGSYVVALIERGVDPKNIYAVETSPAIFRLGSNMFSRLGVNYIRANFLTWKPNMSFDVAVANPPFQNGGNSAYYTLFFRKIRELLQEGGYFSIVSPSKAAAPHTKGYKELAKLGWNRVEYGVNDWFPNIDQPIAIYSGRDKPLENKNLEVAYGTSSVKIQRGSVLPVQYINSSKLFRGADIDLTLSIFRKFFSVKAEKVKERFETLPEAPGCPYVYLASVAWRYHPLKEKGGPYGLHAKVNDHDKYLNGNFMRFESQKEAENMGWLLSKSLVYRFVAGASCRAKFLPKVLREETPDLSKCSTDEQLFELLGFTEKEVSYLNLWNEQTNTPGRVKK